MIIMFAGVLILNRSQNTHNKDVIMTTMASQITSLTVVNSTVYSDADQRKHQSSVSLAFVWGIHRDRWIPRTKDQLRGKCFHLMTSSCSRATILTRLILWCHSHINHITQHTKHFMFMKSEVREILVYTFPITLKFDILWKRWRAMWSF